VFIGECLVTAQNDADAKKMMQSFSDITQSMVFTSDHSVPSGYTYKGNSSYLNSPEASEGGDVNDYHIFSPNQKSKEVYDLKIRQNGWFNWNKKDSTK